MLIRTIKLSGKFVDLRTSYTDSDNETLWYADDRNGNCFSMRSNKNNQIILRFFPCKYKGEKTKISDAALVEGLTLLCQHLAQSGPTPYVIITSKSSSRLFSICRKAHLKTRKGYSRKTFFYEERNRICE